MKRGQVWWADLPEPLVSEPGFRRPVVIVQADEFNRSHINTVVVVALTSNLKLGAAPGNVRLPTAQSGLDKTSVANVSQLITLDKRFLVELAGRLDSHALQQIETGIRLVLAL